MGSTRKKQTLDMVKLAMLVALVVVLQLISAIIPPIGGVSITLTLVPVVIGAILFDIKGGAILGFFFGLIVLINCITGLDFGGNLLWNANPFFTETICFAKGIAAGIVPALIYKLLADKKNKNASGIRKYFSALAAALMAPIVNTALFVGGMFLFFTDTLYAWAGGTDMLSYIIFGLAGLNFLIEAIINIALTPAIIRIVDAVKKK